MTTELKGSWELTKQHSEYHFDNFKFDPNQDKVTTLGNIDPFWKDELSNIIDLAKPKTWRTRGKGADRPANEYDEEEYDLEKFGYGKDYVVGDLTWDVPETFNKIAVWFGIPEETLKYNFQDYIIKGREDMKQRLRQAMMKNALGGHAVMQIFLAKNMLGMSDNPVNTDDDRILPWADTV
jgi:hypothetical protein